MLYESLNPNIDVESEVPLVDLNELYESINSLENDLHSDIGEIMDSKDDIEYTKEDLEKLIKYEIDKFR